MSDKSPGIKEWEKLYQTAIKLKEIGPWNWLAEDDLFTVQKLDTDEIGFVSVMGAIGEHYAVSVYLGEKGFLGFLELQKTPEGAPSLQTFFETPQLQLSFEDRNVLHPQDLAIIKKLGLKFRGKQEYPLFRSFQPGFFPWYLNQDEAAFLQCILEQTIDVTQRSEYDDSILRPGNGEGLLLRKWTKKDGKILWKDATLKSLPLAPAERNYSVDESAVQALRSMKSGKAALEIDVCMFPEPIKEGDMKPYFPYMILMIDADQGAIVQHELLQPIPTLESMWERIPSQVIKQMANLDFLPATVFIRSNALHASLTDLLGSPGFTIELTDRLPFVDKAYASMMEFLK